MLGLWAFIEADFLRDYGMDISRSGWLLGITWRRFNTLLQGLSPRGAVAVHYDSVAKKEREEQDGRSDAGAESFWRMMATTGKPGGRKKENKRMRA